MHLYLLQIFIQQFQFLLKMFSPLFIPIFKYFQILFKKVLKGEVTPDHLIRMSPEELASKELAAWRRRENRHVRLSMNMCLAMSEPVFFSHRGEIIYIHRGNLTECAVIQTSCSMLLLNYLSSINWVLKFNLLFSLSLLLFSHFLQLEGYIINLCFVIFHKSERWEIRHIFS